MKIRNLLTMIALIAGSVLVAASDDMYKDTQTSTKNTQ